MSARKLLLNFSQFFLVLAFLCVPLADNAHAMRMLQIKHGGIEDTLSKPQEKMLITAQAPCHEPMLVSVETTPDQAQTNNSDDKKPCCPYKQCSPNNCLMHFAFVAFSVFEIIPHSPIDSQTFLDADIHLVSLPVTERLRPPIA